MRLNLAIGIDHVDHCRRKGDFWCQFGRLTKIFGQLLSAVHAEIGIGAMTLGHAAVAGTSRRFGQGFFDGLLRDHLGRHDTGRYRENPPAEHHHHRGNEASDIRLGCDIPKAHRCHGGDRPVDRGRYAGKTIFRTFGHIQCRAEDDHQRHDDRQEDADLAAAVGDCQQQPLIFLHIAGHLQDPENPQKPQYAHIEQHIGLGDEQRNKARQDRQQIDHAEEAFHISPGIRATGDASEILEREHDREEPLDRPQPFVVGLMNRLHAVEHDHQEADDDRPHQQQVKAFACDGVRLKNDVVPPQAPA